MFAARSLIVVDAVTATAFTLFFLICFQIKPLNSGDTIETCDYTLFACEGVISCGDPSTGVCIVSCFAIDSQTGCRGATINANQAVDMTVVCGAANSGFQDCFDSHVFCPAVSGASCALQCTGADSCQGVDVVTMYPDDYTCTPSVNCAADVRVHIPSPSPTAIPSAATNSPSSAHPSVVPSAMPSVMPTEGPTDVPSGVPSQFPSSDAPTQQPSNNPSAPSWTPTVFPTAFPTTSTNPTSMPSGNPSRNPTRNPANANQGEVGDQGNADTDAGAKRKRSSADNGQLLIIIAVSVSVAAVVLVSILLCTLLLCCYLRRNHKAMDTAMKMKSNGMHTMASVSGSGLEDAGVDGAPEENVSVAAAQEGKRIVFPKNRESLSFSTTVDDGTAANITTQLARPPQRSRTQPPQQQQQRQLRQIGINDIDKNNDIGILPSQYNPNNSNSNPNSNALPLNIIDAMSMGIHMQAILKTKAEIKVAESVVISPMSSAPRMPSNADAELERAPHIVDESARELLSTMITFDGYVNNNDRNVNIEMMENENENGNDSSDVLQVSQHEDEEKHEQPPPNHTVGLVIDENENEDEDEDEDGDEKSANDETETETATVISGLSSVSKRRLSSNLNNEQPPHQHVHQWSMTTTNESVNKHSKNVPHMAHDNHSLMSFGGYMNSKSNNSLNKNSALPSQRAQKVLLRPRNTNLYEIEDGKTAVESDGGSVVSLLSGVTSAGSSAASMTQTQTNTTTMVSGSSSNNSRETEATESGADNDESESESESASAESGESETKSETF